MIDLPNGHQVLAARRRIRDRSDVEITVGSARVSLESDAKGRPTAFTWQER
jgi:hypothetical protein